MVSFMLCVIYHNLNRRTFQVKPLQDDGRWHRDDRSPRCHFSSVGRTPVSAPLLVYLAGKGLEDAIESPDTDTGGTPPSHGTPDPICSHLFQKERAWSWGGDRGGNVLKFIKCLLLNKQACTSVISLKPKSQFH